MCVCAGRVLFVVDFMIGIVLGIGGLIVILLRTCIDIFWIFWIKVENRITYYCIIHYTRYNIRPTAGHWSLFRRGYF